MIRSEHLADMTAIVSIIGTLLGYLPAVGALLGVVWYCMLIGEKIVSWRKRARQAKDG